MRLLHSILCNAIVSVKGKCTSSLDFIGTLSRHLVDDNVSVAYLLRCTVDVRYLAHHIRVISPKMVSDAVYMSSPCAHVHSSAFCFRAVW